MAHITMFHPGADSKIREIQTEANADVKIRLTLTPAEFVRMGRMMTEGLNRTGFMVDPESDPVGASLKAKMTRSAVKFTDAHGRASLNEPMKEDRFHTWVLALRREMDEGLSADEVTLVPVDQDC